jgi:hypothetical protein
MKIALDLVRRTGKAQGTCAGDNVAVPFNRRRFAVQLVIAKSQHQKIGVVDDGNLVRTEHQH